MQHVATSTAATNSLCSTEPPSLPRSLRVDRKGSRELSLAWSAPLDGNSPLTQYTLRYTPLLGTWRVVVAEWTVECVAEWTVKCVAGGGGGVDSEVCGGLWWRSGQ